MIKFFEKVGAQSDECKLVNDFVVESVAEVVLGLTSDAPAVLRKAPQLPSCVLVSWEHMVMDGTLTFYRRLYAWSKLVRVWSCMRSSDALGAHADKLSLTADGLHGVIMQSKTSGKTKKVAVLHFHVAVDSWLSEKGWLSTGFALSQQGGATGRRCLLTLPTEDESALTDIEPSFMQSCAASRHLMASAKTVVSGLVMPDGAEVCWKSTDIPLLMPGVQTYWQEHSDRAFLSTCGRAIDISKEDCDMAGRWGAKDSQSYVRVSKQVTLQTQAKVAAAIRNAGAEDVLMEEDMLCELERFLLGRSWDKQLVSEQLTRLRSMRAAAAVVTGPDNVTPSPITPVSCSGEELVNEPLSEGSWVISLARGGREQTLHRIGSCYRVPGLHYLRYSILDESEMDLEYGITATYDKVCADCFPKGIRKSDIGGDSSSVDASSDSSSDTD
ncbi:unnamed protein product [Polarella glacialis]|uniref:Uncharacterized protein n=1 Tax=Polarella glacialis TaxID=89957 RepID=A0A813DLG7_POLGL|nr:unnamed protein product [Polarella glacialis]